MNPLPYLDGASWELVRCSACGQLAHAKVLDEEWSRRWFDEWVGEAAIREFERRAHSAGFADRGLMRRIRPTVQAHFVAN